MATHVQTFHGDWNYLCALARAHWNQLTEDDLPALEGNIEQLVSRIQKKTGEGRESIEKFFTEMTARVIGGRVCVRGSRPVRPTGERPDS